jgi:hypothetical protein
MPTDVRAARRPYKMAMPRSLQPARAAAAAPALCAAALTAAPAGASGLAADTLQLTSD